MHRHRHPQRSVDGLKLFTDEAQRNVIEAGAAESLGNADAEQIEFGHLPENFGMCFLLLVPLFDIGGDLFLRELAHGLYQGFVVVGKLKIDHGAILYHDPMVRSELTYCGSTSGKMRT